jgi:hypothetical protein
MTPSQKISLNSKNPQKTVEKLKKHYKNLQKTHIKTRKKVVLEIDFIWPQK